MAHQLPFYLALLVGILLLIMLAKRVNVAYPIVLVLGGLLVSFIPGIPNAEIEPELIFVIFLPPLLYEAAWNTSWKSFNIAILTRRFSYGILIRITSRCLLLPFWQSFVPAG